MLGRSKSLRKPTKSIQPTEIEDKETAGGRLPQHIPTGLVNDGNTCYLNSVFQSLIHTPPLSTLLTPIDVTQPPYQPPTTIQVDRQRCPALMADRNEHRDLMPLAASFCESAGRSWRTELKAVDGERKGQGLKTLLYTISRKYDQYGDYAQQDSHELLRHLLDSIRMEEVDVIKRLHPPKDGNTTEPPTPPFSRPASPDPNLPASYAPPEFPLSPTVSPPPANIGLPNIGVVNETQSTSPAVDGLLAKGSKTNGAVGKKSSREKEPPHEMVSFIDLLFGGRLASMIVCETCKSVSHTYEDFMDLSLGLPQEEPRERKRDRLMSMAQRLKSKIVRPDTDSNDDENAIASDDEDDDGNSVDPVARTRSFSRRLTSGEEENMSRVPGSRRMTVGDRSDGSSNAGGIGPNLGRRGSIFAGLTNRKMSVSSRRGSQAQADALSASGSVSRSSSPAGSERDTLNALPPSTSSLSTSTTLFPSSTTPQFNSNSDPKFPKLRPSQAAYISRILNAAGDSALSNSKATALIDALKQFTAVEILEGENSFACKKCWRWENPRSDGKPWRRGGERASGLEDELEDSETEGTAGPAAGDGGTSGGDSTLESIQDVDDDIEIRAALSHLSTDPKRLSAIPQEDIYLESAPVTAGNSPGSSEADLADSIVSAPGALATPTAFGGGLSRIESHRRPNPDINIIPFSPENEPEQFIAAAPSLPASISATPLESPTTPIPNSSVSGSPSISTSFPAENLTPSQPASAPPPAKSSSFSPISKTAIGLRPAASRGLSFTNYANPLNRQPESESDDDSDDDGNEADDDGLSVIDEAASRVSREKTKKADRYILRRAFKRYLVVNPPPILVIHFKRFEQLTGRGFGGFGGFAGNFKKIDSYLSFPEQLDLAPFLAPARVGAPVTVTNAPVKARENADVVVDAVRYNLNAVVCHIGNMNSGHYVSYVLSSPDAPPPLHSDSLDPTPPDATAHEPIPAPPDAPDSPSTHPSIPLPSATRGGKPEKDPRVWYYCSDEAVKRVSVDHVLGVRAYLLFYERC